MLFRPCNGTEVAAAWNTAIRTTTGPTAIILSRQEFEQIETPASADVNRGAYIVYHSSNKNVKMTIVATGSEVPIAIRVANIIGNSVQVVSMPCVEIFRNQDLKYKQEIMRGFVVAIEAAASAPWFEFADAVVGIDRFGISDDGDKVYANMGMNAEAIANEILHKAEK